MPKFKKNTSPAMYKKGPFKMKSSPAKLFGSKKRKEKREKIDELVNFERQANPDPMYRDLSEKEKRKQAKSMLGY